MSQGLISWSEVALSMSLHTLMHSLTLYRSKYTLQNHLALQTLKFKGFFVCGIDIRGITAYKLEVSKVYFSYKGSQ